MTVAELKQKIEANKRMDRRFIVIGETPCYDEAFNLIMRQRDGSFVSLLHFACFSGGSRIFPGPGRVIWMEG